MNRRLLFVVLLLAFCLRLAWAMSRPADDASLRALPDRREYLDLARNLLHGQGLKFYDPRFNDEVRAFRAPGYPLLIAACGGNVRILRIVQALLDTSMILAVYLLARRWLSDRGALFATTLLAVNPYMIYFAGLVLSETLFTALLAWGMLLLQRKSFAWLAGAALLTASILVRPGAILLPLVLAVASQLLNPTPLRWRVPVGATMVLLALAILFPWAARNRYTTGRWIWTSTNGGITTYDGFNPDANGASDQDKIIKTLPQLRMMGELGRDVYLKERASEFVREYPLESLKLAAVKIARTWSPRPLSEQFGKRSYVAAALAYSVPFDLLVLAGLYAGRLPRMAKVFLMLPAIYFTASAAMSVGSLRYRVPAEAPMAIVAASVRIGAPGFKRFESTDV